MFRACFAPPVSIISRAGVLHAQGCLICQSLLERQFASVRILDYSSGDTIEEWSADIFVRNAGVVNTEADKNHHADKSAPPATKIRHFQGNVQCRQDLPLLIPEGWPTIAQRLTVGCAGLEVHPPPTNGTRLGPRIVAGISRPHNNLAHRQSTTVPHPQPELHRCTSVTPL